MVALSKFQPKKILVAGDLMLDAYTIGKANRISPEAPVAVISVTGEEQRPGGAGNVALNLVSLGCPVTLLARTGADSSGLHLKEDLDREGVDTSFLFVDPTWPTPVKHRVIAENQQVVRIDREVIAPIPEDLEEKIIGSLSKILEGVFALAISDYGKGFLTETLLSRLIAAAGEKNIPVIVDPKGFDFSKYYGAGCIKPNVSEAYAAASLPLHAPLEQVAKNIFTQTACQSLLITRSEKGMSLFHATGERIDFGVRERQVKDVTGAGDTVLAALSASVASGMSLSDAACLANLAAGIAIETFGCARVSISALARRLLKENVGCKIFDEEHLFAFHQALSDAPFVILGISNENQLIPSLIGKIHREIKKPGIDLVVYLQDPNPTVEALEFLASLHEIDFVVVKREGFAKFIEKLEPQSSYLVENGQLKICDSAFV